MEAMNNVDGLACGHDISKYILPNIQYIVFPGLLSKKDFSILALNARQLHDRSNISKYLDLR